MDIKTVTLTEADKDLIYRNYDVVCEVCNLSGTLDQIADTVEFIPEDDQISWVCIEGCRLSEYDGGDVVFYDFTLPLAEVLADVREAAGL